MTTEPEPAFLEEGAIMLQAYLGINPIENARSAAEGVWYWLCNEVLPQPPRQWREALAWMEHPQMQANLAYWKAMGPWLIKQGQHPIPAEDWEEPKAPAATVVEMMPPLEQIVMPPKPLPKLIELPPECYTDGPLEGPIKPIYPTLRLDVLLRTQLVRLAENCADRTRVQQPWQELNETMLNVVVWVKKQNLWDANVFVAGIKDFSPPAKVIVKYWMDEVRLKPGLRDMRIFFKFEPK